MINIDTLQNRIEFQPNVIEDTRGPTLDDIYIYVYNDEGLDHSVRGAGILSEIGKLMHILRCKRLKNNQNFYKPKL